MSPEQFTQIKQRIEASTILNPTEKKEWLFLLPRMTEQEIKELDRILAIKLPPRVLVDNKKQTLDSLGKAPLSEIQAVKILEQASSPVPRPVVPETRIDGVMNRPRISEAPRPIPPLPNPPPQGEGIREREVLARKENKNEFLPLAGVPQNSTRLRGGLEGGGEVGVRVVPQTLAKPIPPRQAKPQPAASIRRPDAIPQKPVIPELARLMSLSMDDMRRETSIYVFLENLNKDIQTMIAKRIATADILNAFEKSPLHKSYLQVGLKLMNREKNVELSLEEFETLTDFRTNLQRL